VVLNVAEAYLRQAHRIQHQPLALVNGLRAAVVAAKAILPLNPTTAPVGGSGSVVDDQIVCLQNVVVNCTGNPEENRPIRFGMYLTAWQYKPADQGTTNLLFLIPNQALGVNPNLAQNPGY
jgi:hypothetical protein